MAGQGEQEPPLSVRAGGKNTKGKANTGGSQANVQHDGLMALESRLLFSAAAPLSAAQLRGRDISS